MHSLLAWWNHRPALLPVAVLILSLGLLNERRRDVQPLVNVARNGLDLGSQLLLDTVEIESILVRDQVDGQTKVTETTRTTDSVQVSLGVLGEVKVDDNVDGLDIDTSGQQIGTDQVTAGTVAEIVENPVSMRLEHLCVRVEAAVAELGDLFGEQLDTVSRIAKDDGLVDLELGKERVETVHFLAFLNESVVLRDTAQRELVHEVDLVGLDHVAVLEILDDERERGREEHDLPLLGEEAEELLHDGGELGRQELVSFVHDESGALAEVGDAFASEIEDTTGSTDEHVDGLSETEDIVTKGSTTGSDHDFDAEVLSESLCDLTCLERQFTGGDEEDSLDLVLLGVELFERRDDVGGGLSRSVLGTRENVATGECDGDGLFLDGRGTFEAGFKDAHEEFAFEEVIFELVALGIENIFGLGTFVFGELGGDLLLPSGFGLAWCWT